jgi:4-carboxymuconolactone decarboxylase
MPSVNRGSSSLVLFVVQLCACTGSPRTLNALGRADDGRRSPQAARPWRIGASPGRCPPGRDPVRGPLFGFSPQIDEYLKTHSFGAIFARDNPAAIEQVLANR